MFFIKDDACKSKTMRKPSHQEVFSKSLFLFKSEKKFFYNKVIEMLNHPDFYNDIQSESVVSDYRDLSISLPECLQSPQETPEEARTNNFCSKRTKEIYSVFGIRKVLSIFVST